MKKLFLISAIFLSAFTYKAEAQVRVNINIGSQPIWGPVGYDYVDYYYLPEMDVYYNVPRQEFVYFDFGRWIFAASLPSRYGRYDFFNTYKVVINERDPWLRNTYYRNQYGGYRGQYQPIIRDSREQKYFVIRDHPEHDRFYNNQRQIQNNQRDVEFNRNRVNNRDNNGNNRNQGSDNRDYSNRNNNNRNQASDNRNNGNRNNNRGNNNRDHGNDGNQGRHH